MEDVMWVLDAVGIGALTCRFPVDLRCLFSVVTAGCHGVDCMWLVISSGKLMIPASCGIVLPGGCTLYKHFPRKNIWMRLVIRMSSCAWFASGVPIGVGSLCLILLIHLVFFRLTSVLRDVL